MSQLHMLHFHLLMQEDAGAFLKAFGTLGREITARTATGELRFDVRMTFEIGLKTARNTPGRTYFTILGIRRG